MHAMETTLASSHLVNSSPMVQAISIAGHSFLPEKFEHFFLSCIYVPIVLMHIFYLNSPIIMSSDSKALASTNRKQWVFFSRKSFKRNSKNAPLNALTREGSITKRELTTLPAAYLECGRALPWCIRVIQMLFLPFYLWEKYIFVILLKDMPF